VADIELRVYDPTGVTLIGTLTQDFDRSWEDVLNDVGSGQVSLLVGSSDLAMLTPRRIVVCRLNGVDRFAWVVGGVVDASPVHPGEEAREVVRKTGLGVASLFSKVKVYPEVALGVATNATYRYFNFASFDYDHTSWVAATEIKLQSDVGLIYMLADGVTPGPSNWPDPDAYWIWSSAATGGTPPMAVGSSYFRKIFTLADETSVAVLITADDGYRLFLDGDLLAEETTAYMWGETRRHDVTLGAGDHIIAIEGINANRASAATNIAAVLCTVVETDGDGNIPETPTVITHTDSTWKALDYPAEAPTMTPGQIINIILGEAHARGRMTHLNQNTTATLDSNGNAWAESVDIAVPVGQTSLLDVLKLMADQDIIDFHVTPDLMLEAFNAGTMGAASGVTLARGTNLLDWRVTGEDAIVDVVLARYGTGEWDEFGSGDWEEYLEVASAPSLGAVTRAANAVLNHWGVEHRIGSGGVVPTIVEAYADLAPGDTCTAPDEERNARANSVVLSVTIADDVHRVGLHTFNVEVEERF
jgi:hypothetical protein